MRLLFLTSRQLGDPRSGGTIKSAAVLAHLEHRHRVDVVAFRRPGEAPWGRANGPTFTLPIERDRSVRNLLKSYATGVPLSIERNRSTELPSRVEELVASREYDAVFVDGWLMAQYVPSGFSGRRLLHQHNAEHVMWRRHAELEPNPLRRVVVRIEADRVRRYERSMLQTFDIVFAVSEPDRRALLEIGGAPDEVVLLPNVPDPALAGRPDLVPGRDPVLLFLGTLSWPPNVEGLSRFLRTGFPELLDRVPEARLIVAGAGAPASLARLADRRCGVEFVGTVEDDEDLYRRARCFVDVGLGGAGSRVKVLNALARGLPVVTTSEGAAGLEVVPGEHLLVAERPEAMVEPVVRILTDDLLWTSLHDRGKALIKQRYVPEVAFAELDRTLGDGGAAR